MLIPEYNIITLVTTRGVVLPPEGAQNGSVGRPELYAMAKTQRFCSTFGEATMEIGPHRVPIASRMLQEVLTHRRKHQPQPEL